MDISCIIIKNSLNKINLSLYSSVRSVEYIIIYTSTNRYISKNIKTSPSL